LITDAESWKPKKRKKTSLRKYDFGNAARALQEQMLVARIAIQSSTVN
jgi:hypothetical protein